MHNILLVAQHEFMTNIRKRSFLFAVFGVPLIMGLIFGVTFFVQLQSEVEGIIAERIGYVEQTTSFVPVITQESEMFISYQTIREATAALDNDEVDVFFVITPNYINSGSVLLYSYGSVGEETREDIELFIVENITSSVVSEVPPERLIEPVDFTIFMENTGRELNLNGLIGLLLTPILFAMIMLMALQLSSTYLMSGVVEEKTNHIMELLITSITPYQLLTGKLLGLGALGLIQMLVWIVLGAVGVQFNSNIEVLAGIVLPWDYLLLVVVYFILSYFLSASLLAGIGAVVGSEQESRTYATGVSLLNVVPMIFLSALLLNPETPLFTWMLFIPFTAGMTYMLKFPFAAIPIWQIALSLSILTVTTIFVTWASAKVFRWALLLYGKKPSLKTLWTVITGQQEIGVITDTTPEMEQTA